MDKGLISSVDKITTHRPSHDHSLRRQYHEASRGPLSEKHLVRQCHQTATSTPIEHYLMSMFSEIEKSPVCDKDPKREFCETAMSPPLKECQMRKSSPSCSPVRKFHERVYSPSEEIDLLMGPLLEHYSMQKSNKVEISQSYEYSPMTKADESLRSPSQERSSKHRFGEKESPILEQYPMRKTVEQEVSGPHEHGLARKSQETRKSSSSEMCPKRRFTEKARSPLHDLYPLKKSGEQIISASHEHTPVQYEETQKSPSLDLHPKRRFTEKARSPLPEQCSKRKFSEKARSPFENSQVGKSHNTQKSPSLELRPKRRFREKPRSPPHEQRSRRRFTEKARSPSLEKILVKMSEMATKPSIEQRPMGISIEQVKSSPPHLIKMSSEQVSYPLPQEGPTENFQEAELHGVRQLQQTVKTPLEQRLMKISDDLTTSPSLDQRLLRLSRDDKCEDRHTKSTLPHSSHLENNGTRSPYCKKRSRSRERVRSRTEHRSRSKDRYNHSRDSHQTLAPVKPLDEYMCRSRHGYKPMFQMQPSRGCGFLQSQGRGQRGRSLQEYSRGQRSVSNKEDLRKKFERRGHSIGYQSYHRGKERARSRRRSKERRSRTRSSSRSHSTSRSSSRSRSWSSRSSRSRSSTYSRSRSRSSTYSRSRSSSRSRSRYRARSRSTERSQSSIHSRTPERRPSIPIHKEILPEKNNDSSKPCDRRALTDPRKTSDHHPSPLAFIPRAITKKGPLSVIQTSKGTSSSATADRKVNSQADIEPETEKVGAPESNFILNTPEQNTSDIPKSKFIYKLGVKGKTSVPPTCKTVAAPIMKEVDIEPQAMKSVGPASMPETEMSKPDLKPERTLPANGVSETELQSEVIIREHTIPGPKNGNSTVDSSVGPEISRILEKTPETTTPKVSKSEARYETVWCDSRGLPVERIPDLNVRSDAKSFTESSKQGTIKPSTGPESELTSSSQPLNEPEVPSVAKICGGEPVSLLESGDETSDITVAASTTAFSPQINKAKLREEARRLAKRLEVIEGPPGPRSSKLRARRAASLKLASEKSVAASSTSQKQKAVKQTDSDNESMIDTHQVVSVEESKVPEPQISKTLVESESLTSSTSAMSDKLDARDKTKNTDPGSTTVSEGNDSVKEPKVPEHSVKKPLVKPEPITSRTATPLLLSDKSELQDKTNELNYNVPECNVSSQEDVDSNYLVSKLLVKSELLTSTATMTSPPSDKSDLQQKIKEVNDGDNESKLHNVSVHDSKDSEHLFRKPLIKSEILTSSPKSSKAKTRRAVKPTLAVKGVQISKPSEIAVAKTRSRTSNSESLALEARTLGEMLAAAAREGELAVLNCLHNLFPLPNAARMDYGESKELGLTGSDVRSDPPVRRSFWGISADEVEGDIALIGAKYSCYLEESVVLESTFFGEVDMQEAKHPLTDIVTGDRLEEASIANVESKGAFLNTFSRGITVNREEESSDEGTEYCTCGLDDSSDEATDQEQSEMNLKIVKMESCAAQTNLITIKPTAQIGMVESSEPQTCSETIFLASSEQVSSELQEMNLSIDKVESCAAETGFEAVNHEPSEQVGNEESDNLNTNSEIMEQKASKLVDNDESCNAPTNSDTMEVQPSEQVHGAECERPPDNAETMDMETAEQDNDADPETMEVEPSTEVNDWAYEKSHTNVQTIELKSSEQIDNGESVKAKAKGEDGESERTPANLETFNAEPFELVGNLESDKAHSHLEAIDEKPSEQLDKVECYKAHTNLEAVEAGPSKQVDKLEAAKTHANLEPLEIEVAEQVDRIASDETQTSLETLNLKPSEDVDKMMSGETQTYTETINIEPGEEVGSIVSYLATIQLSPNEQVDAVRSGEARPYLATIKLKSAYQGERTSGETDTYLETIDLEPTEEVEKMVSDEAQAYLATVSLEPSEQADPKMSGEAQPYLATVKLQPTQQTPSKQLPWGLTESADLSLTMDKEEFCEALENLIMIKPNQQVNTLELDKAQTKLETLKISSKTTQDTPSKAQELPQGLPVSADVSLIIDKEESCEAPEDLIMLISSQQVDTLELDKAPKRLETLELASKTTQDTPSKAQDLPQGLTESADVSLTIDKEESCEASPNLIKTELKEQVDTVELDKVKTNLETLEMVSTQETPSKEPSQGLTESTDVSLTLDKAESCGAQPSLMMIDPPEQLDTMESENALTSLETIEIAPTEKFPSEAQEIPGGLEQSSDMSLWKDKVESCMAEPFIKTIKQEPIEQVEDMVSDEACLETSEMQLSDQVDTNSPGEAQAYLGTIKQELFEESDDVDSGKVQTYVETINQETTQQVNKIESDETNLINIKLEPTKDVSSEQQELNEGINYSSFTAKEDPADIPEYKPPPCFKMPLTVVKKNYNREKIRLKAGGLTGALLDEAVATRNWSAMAEVIATTVTTAVLKTTIRVEGNTRYIEDHSGLLPLKTSTHYDHDQSYSDHDEEALSRSQAASFTKMRSRSRSPVLRRDVVIEDDLDYGASRKWSRSRERYRSGSRDRYSRSRSRDHFNRLRSPEHGIAKRARHSPSPQRHSRVPERREARPTERIAKTIAMMRKESDVTAREGRRHREDGAEYSHQDERRRSRSHERTYSSDRDRHYSSSKHSPDRCDSLRDKLERMKKQDADLIAKKEITEKYEKISKSYKELMKKIDSAKKQAGLKKERGKTVLTVTKIRDQAPELRESRKDSKRKTISTSDRPEKIKKKATKESSSKLPKRDFGDAEKASRLMSSKNRSDHPDDAKKDVWPVKERVGAKKRRVDRTQFDFRQTKAVGGRLLNEAIQARDWTGMGEMVATENRPGAKHHIWIFGDLSIYQASHIAKAHLRGPNLYLPQDIQLVWIGIPGLLLSEVGVALRCFMDTHPNMGRPTMMILHVGTEDVRDMIKETRDPIHKVLYVLRKSLPKTKLVWSEVLVHKTVTYQLQNVASRMRRFALKEVKALPNTDFCSNTSFQLRTELFRPRMMYLNNAMDLIQHFKSFILDNLAKGESGYDTRNHDVPEGHRKHHGESQSEKSRHASGKKKDTGTDSEKSTRGASDAKKGTKKATEAEKDEIEKSSKEDTKAEKSTKGGEGQDKGSKPETASEKDTKESPESEKDAKDNALSEKDSEGSADTDKITASNSDAEKSETKDSDSPKPSSDASDLQKCSQAEPMKGLFEPKTKHSTWNPVPWPQMESATKSDGVQTSALWPHDVKSGVEPGSKSETSVENSKADLVTAPKKTTFPIVQKSASTGDTGSKTSQLNQSVAQCLRSLSETEAETKKEVVVEPVNPGRTIGALVADFNPNATPAVTDDLKIEPDDTKHKNPLLVADYTSDPEEMAEDRAEAKPAETEAGEEKMEVDPPPYGDTEESVAKWLSDVESDLKSAAKNDAAVVDMKIKSEAESENAVSSDIAVADAAKIKSEPKSETENASDSVSGIKPEPASEVEVEKEEVDMEVTEAKTSDEAVEQTGKEAVQTGKEGTETKEDKEKVPEPVPESKSSTAEDPMPKGTTKSEQSEKVQEDKPFPVEQEVEQNSESEDPNKVIVTEQQTNTSATEAIGDATEQPEMVKSETVSCSKQEGLDIKGGNTENKTESVSQMKEEESIMEVDTIGAVAETKSDKSGDKTEAVSNQKEVESGTTEDNMKSQDIDIPSDSKEQESNIAESTVDVSDEKEIMKDISETEAKTAVSEQDKTCSDSDGTTAAKKEVDNSCDMKSTSSGLSSEAVDYSKGESTSEPLQNQEQMDTEESGKQDKEGSSSEIIEPVGEAQASTSEAEAKTESTTIAEPVTETKAESEISNDQDSKPQSTSDSVQSGLDTTEGKKPDTESINDPLVIPYVPEATKVIAESTSTPAAEDKNTASPTAVNSDKKRVLELTIKSTDGTDGESKAQDGSELP